MVLFKSTGYLGSFSFEYQPLYLCCFLSLHHPAHDSLLQDKRECYFLEDLFESKIFAFQKSGKCQLNGYSSPYLSSIREKPKRLLSIPDEHDVQP